TATRAPAMMIIDAAALGSGSNWFNAALSPIKAPVAARRTARPGPISSNEESLNSHTIPARSAMAPTRIKRDLETSFMSSDHLLKAIMAPARMATMPRRPPRPVMSSPKSRSERNLTARAKIITAPDFGELMTGLGGLLGIVAILAGAM